MKRSFAFFTLLLALLLSACAVPDGTAQPPDDDGAPGAPCMVYFDYPSGYLQFCEEITALDDKALESYLIENNFSINGIRDRASAEELIAFMDSLYFPVSDAGDYSATVYLDEEIVHVRLETYPCNIVTMGIRAHTGDGEEAFIENEYDLAYVSEFEKGKIDFFETQAEDKVGVIHLPDTDIVVVGVAGAEIESFGSLNKVIQAITFTRAEETVSINQELILRTPTAEEKELSRSALVLPD